MPGSSRLVNFKQRFKWHGNFANCMDWKSYADATWWGGNDLPRSLLPWNLDSTLNACLKWSNHVILFVPPLACWIFYFLICSSDLHLPFVHMRSGIPAMVYLLSSYPVAARKFLVEIYWGFGLVCWWNKIIKSSAINNFAPKIYLFWEETKSS